MGRKPGHAGDSRATPYPEVKDRSAYMRKAKPRKADTVLEGKDRHVRPPSSFWSDVAHALKDDGRVKRFDTRPAKRLAKSYEHLFEPSINPRPSQTWDEHKLQQELLLRRKNKAD